MKVSYRQKQIEAPKGCWFLLSAPCPPSLSLRRVRRVSAESKKLNKSSACSASLRWKWISKRPPF